jgi:hypothetical protein
MARSKRGRNKTCGAYKVKIAVHRLSEDLAGNAVMNTQVGMKAITLKIKVRSYGQQRPGGIYSSTITTRNS